MCFVVCVCVGVCVCVCVCIVIKWFVVIPCKHLYCSDHVSEKGPYSLSKFLATNHTTYCTCRSSSCVPHSTSGGIGVLYNTVCDQISSSTAYTSPALNKYFAS